MHSMTGVSHSRRIHDLPTHGEIALGVLVCIKPLAEAVCSSDVIDPLMQMRDYPRNASP